MSQQKPRLGPVKGCLCYGANTPDLDGFCPCQNIDLRPASAREAEPAPGGTAAGRA